MVEVEKESVTDKAIEQVKDEWENKDKEQKQQILKSLLQSDKTKHNLCKIKYGHKIGRNDLCPCRSGKKYKNCCYEKDKIEIK